MASNQFLSVPSAVRLRRGDETGSSETKTSTRQSSVYPMTVTLSTKYAWNDPLSPEHDCFNDDNAHVFLDCSI